MAASGSMGDHGVNPAALPPSPDTAALPPSPDTVSLTPSPDTARLPTSPDIRTLVRDYHHDVYRYAFRLSGSHTDAEDLTQQTFMIAHQRLPQLRQPDRALSWLFAILRTCYLKAERKTTPLTATSIELDVDNIPERANEDPIDQELLQAALDELPEEFKLVLVMFYFEECSYKEIADQLQIPIGTVMSRLTRAKGRLRQRLSEAEHDPGPTATDVSAENSRGKLGRSGK